jgi:hypothetical protein
MNEITPNTRSHKVDDEPWNNNGTAQKIMYSGVLA